MASIHDKAPVRHSSEFKRVKIIATLGPSTNNYESILNLIKAGANGIRLNFSHGENDERIQQIKWIRKASKEYSKPVAIIQDLQGPKIRLGEFEGIINVQKNQEFKFGYKVDYERSGVIPTQYDLSKKVKKGERLYIFDGRICTTVEAVKDNLVYVRAENDGILISRKGINLPDTNLEGDIITAKDKKDIIFGVEHDIDFVALSFVQSAEDVIRLRTILRNFNSNAKIIAKIETNSGAENLEEIVEESDAVMVARGDLAIETLHESVPIIQNKLIGLGHYYGKPTIIATHMMVSMTESPEPTRAEVSDVATAVMMGADSVMLSEETAVGKHPIESVKMMKRIIRYTESKQHMKVTYEENLLKESKQSAISRVISDLAVNLKASAIVAETKSGATAYEIAATRPEVAIIAVTSDPKIYNQLAICYGTKSFLRPDHKYAATRLVSWLKTNKVLSVGNTVVIVSGRYPGVVGVTDTIKVRVIE